MKINKSKLPYPLNIYDDLGRFADEDSQRCYYYHAVSTAMPQNPEETMDYILSEFYANRGRLLQLIDVVYKEGHTIEEAAELTGNSVAGAREILHAFYRDLLYYPRYNVTLTHGKP